MLYINFPTGQRYSVEVRQGDTVARALWLSGLIKPKALCSGLGHCGQCRVKYLNNIPNPLPIEISLLGTEAIKNGWRLSCHHIAEENMEIALPENHLPNTPQSLMQEISSQGYFLAVDLGTTSIYWRILDKNKSIVKEGHDINPQIGIGSDVISRIQYARTDDGRIRLRNLILQFLSNICIHKKNLEVICIAGNTAMTAILCGGNIESLAHTPYKVPFYGNTFVHFPHLPPIWIPPQPAPFIGGDISAGIAFLLSSGVKYPFLLADMGTNGEFVLCLNPKKSIATSLPLGPALEGIGMYNGVMAGEGSITAFSYGINGFIPQFWHNITPENGIASGICGTGYFSLIALLRRLGVLGIDGQPIKHPTHPLGIKIAHTFIFTNNGWELPVCSGVKLTASDVEELLKIKSVFTIATQQLLKLASIPPHSIEWYLSGCLGEYANIEDLALLGFIPTGIYKNLHTISNTSLNGAELLLTHPEWKKNIEEWSQLCTAFELTSTPHFTHIFTNNMIFQDKSK